LGNELEANPIAGRDNFRDNRGDDRLRL